ncbi:carboxylesterase [Rhodotorula toruloides]|uniref:Carboxylesterase n=1 Tax=Rhodotorula toruloides TaxID=5286 RepID=A0A511KB33_RHOTO|nr:carboxylesterase [Rhodotorula toruloides]
MDPLAGGRDATSLPFLLISSPNLLLSTGRTSNGVDRYTVPYAVPPVGTNRFQDPVDVGTFASSVSLALSPHSCHAPRSFSLDASKLPPVCAQLDTQGQVIGSEDCLYVTIYTPSTATPSSKLPVLAWVHGGSFLTGGTADLDPSAFAKSQKAVVVLISYRLGALGWLKLDKFGFTGNYGLKDVILALKFIQSDIAAYGGDASTVTLAGQSSGAEIVKSLLVTPSASNLFRRAIMHSAPLDYKDQSVETANGVGNAFVDRFAHCSDSVCVKTASLDSLLRAQADLVQQAQFGNLSVPDIALAEPLKTCVDGSLVTRDFRQVVQSGGQLENPSRELIFTTTKDEACITIYGVFAAYFQNGPYPQSFDNPYVQGMLTMFYGNRAAAILDSGLWDPSLLPGDDDAVRKQLIRLGTDFVWTCPNTISARSLSNVGKVFLAQFDIGSPFNGANTPALCKNLVGHQDDLPLLFRIPSSAARLTFVQQTAQLELFARWSAFMRDGDPNARGYADWPLVGGQAGEEKVLVFGGADGRSKGDVQTAPRKDECAVYTFA